MSFTDLLKACAAKTANTPITKISQPIGCDDPLKFAQGDVKYCNGKHGRETSELAQFVLSRKRPRGDPNRLQGYDDPLDVDTTEGLGSDASDC